MTFEEAVSRLDARATALAEGREAVGLDDLRWLFAGTDVHADTAIPWLRSQVKIVGAHTDQEDAVDQLEEGITAYGVVALLIGIELGRASS
jgi:hypothetical protein